MLPVAVPLEGIFKRPAPHGDLHPASLAPWCCSPAVHVPRVHLCSAISGCTAPWPRNHHTTPFGVVWFSQCWQMYSQLGGAGLDLLCSQLKVIPYATWGISSFHGIITLGGGESDDSSSFPLVRIKELSSTSKHRAKKPLYHMHLLQNCCFSPLWRRWFLLKTSVGFTEQIFVNCEVISKNCAILFSLCNHLPEDKMCTAIVSFEEKFKFLFRIL